MRVIALFIGLGLASSAFCVDKQVGPTPESKKDKKNHKKGKKGDVGPTPEVAVGPTPERS